MIKKIKTKPKKPIKKKPIKTKPKIKTKPTPKPTPIPKKLLITAVKKNPVVLDKPKKGRGRKRSRVKRQVITDSEMSPSEKAVRQNLRQNPIPTQNPIKN